MLAEEFAPPACRVCPGFVAVGVDGRARGKLELALLKTSDRERQGARKVLLRFRPSGLDPGRYALAINVKDPKSGKSSEASFPFDIQ
ncbi:MAG: hypothetical protein M3542_05610 [Acidobacteriota bacterium]|nr:hypothetical protein [Acidobacteriota bacterium]MDQ5872775.1 hypothetical protein [Acidobacteriota bacterium]